MRFYITGFLIVLFFISCRPSWLASPTPTNTMHCVKIKKKEVKERMPFYDEAATSFQGEIKYAFHDTLEKVIHVSIWDEAKGYNLQFDESWQIQFVAYSLPPVY